MSDKAKKSFVRSMTAKRNLEEFNKAMTAMKREAKENENEQSGSRRKGTDGSACMTIVPIFNAVNN